MSIKKKPTKENQKQNDFGEARFIHPDKRVEAAHRPKNHQSSLCRLLKDTVGLRVESAPMRRAGRKRTSFLGEDSGRHGRGAGARENDPPIHASLDEGSDRQCNRNT